MLSRPNLITVSGYPGAGKTTLCTKLAEELGWKHFYAGMVFRKIAESMGITVRELSKLAETDKSIDVKTDEGFRDIANSTEPYIAEGRVGWFFLPESFKVMLEVPLIIGAQRVLASDKRVSESYRDLESAMQSMSARRESEREKHRNSYGILNDGDLNHSDLVLDTAYSSPDRNVSFVRAAFSLWQKGIRLPKVWLSPKSLYPTAAIQVMSDEAAQNLVKQYQQNGYDTLQPILAVQHDDQVYIVDGHHRVSAAIRAQCDFVPVVLVAEGHDALRGKNPAAYLQARVKADDIYAWERAHGFLFAMPSNVK